MNHLIDFGVCALTGCTNFVILHNYFKKIFKCILGVQIWCYMVRAQILGERKNWKYSNAKKLNGPRGLEIVLKLENCYLFRWLHTLNLFLLQTYSHLAFETRKEYPHYIDGWVNPLESYWGDYLETLKGFSQLKPVNEPITTKAYMYQDNIKSDI